MSFCHQVKISKKSQYGLRALFHLAGKKGFVSVREIAEEEEISSDYLEKIFFELEKNGIIKSKRGPSGGYALAMNPGKISLRMILETLENTFDLVECVDDGCRRIENCPVAPVWKTLDKEIKEKLELINLKSLIDKNYE